MILKQYKIKYGIEFKRIQYDSLTMKGYYCWGCKKFNHSNHECRLEDSDNVFYRLIPKLCERSRSRHYIYQPQDAT